MTNHPNRSKRNEHVAEPFRSIVNAIGPDMTQRAKHTPGPWHVGKHTRVNIFAGEQLVALPGDGLTYQEAEANARLIAAAPELLAALKVALKCIEYCRAHHPDAQSGTGFPVEIELRAAIAKTEGH